MAQRLVGADLVVQILELLVREERRLLLHERVGRHVQRLHGGLCLLLLLLLHLDLALPVLLLVLPQQGHDLLVLGVVLLARALHAQGRVHELLHVGGRQRHARRLGRRRRHGRASRGLHYGRRITAGEEARAFRLRLVAEQRFTWFQYRSGVWCGTHCFVYET